MKRTSTNRRHLVERGEMEGARIVDIYLANLFLETMDDWGWKEYGGVGCALLCCLIAATGVKGSALQILELYKAANRFKMKVCPCPLALAASPAVAVQYTLLFLPPPPP